MSYEITVEKEVVDTPIGEQVRYKAMAEGMVGVGKTEKIARMNLQDKLDGKD